MEGETPLSRELRDGGIKMIQHHIDDDSGDGNIHPQGPGPASQTLVFDKSIVCGEVKGTQYQGQNDYGQHGVRAENGEIDCFWPAGSGEPGDASSVVVLHAEVVGEVAGEKIAEVMNALTMKPRWTEVLPRLI